MKKNRIHVLIDVTTGIVRTDTDCRRGRDNKGNTQRVERLQCQHASADTHAPTQYDCCTQVVADTDMSVNVVDLLRRLLVATGQMGGANTAIDIRHCQRTCTVSRQREWATPTHRHPPSSLVRAHTCVCIVSYYSFEASFDELSLLTIQLPKQATSRIRWGDTHTRTRSDSHSDR